MNGNNINSVNNIQLNTINGMSPTTIGLTWGDFTGTNAYNNLPNNRYELLNGTYQNIQSYNSNQITNSATVDSLYMDSTMTRISENTFWTNESTSRKITLLNNSDKKVTIDANTPSISIGADNAAVPPPSGIDYTMVRDTGVFINKWDSVNNNYIVNQQYYSTFYNRFDNITYDNGTSTFKDYNIQCNQLLVNGNPIIPTESKTFSFATFNISLSNEADSYGGTPINLLNGTYQLTSTIIFNGSQLSQSDGSYNMVKAYTYLYDNTNTVSYQGYYQSNSILPSAVITYKTTHPTYITYTDTFVLNTTGQYYLGAYQSNELLMGCHCYISGSLIKV